MEEKIIESENLYLRKQIKSDVDDQLLLDSDPDVIKYLRPPKPDRDFYIKNIENIQNYYERNLGYGVWAAIEKKEGRFIGWFSLKYIHKSTDVELGYCLLKEYRGKGYATEMSRKVIEYGFNDLKLNQIFGLTHPDNIISQGILKKLGMHFLEQKDYLGFPTYFYILDSNNYPSVNDNIREDLCNY